MMVEAEPGSFRDPSGQVFLKDGRIFRTVNPSIAEDFDFVERSGLFDELIGKGWLIPAVIRTDRYGPIGVIRWT